MKGYTILLTTAIFFFSCGNKKSSSLQSESDLQKYIEAPSFFDTLCKHEIARAENDVQKGKIYFIAPVYMGGGTLRYKKELNALCKKYNLIFKYNPISDVEIPKQTEGCYSAYMDKIISDKYGLNFKNKLKEQADSIFILRAINDTIDEIFCDIKPRLISNEDGNEFEVPISNFLRKNIKPNNQGKFPFMNLQYVIGTNGNISYYKCVDFYNSDQHSNDKYFNNLLLEARKYIQNETKWKSGLIKGYKVKTKKDIRVYF